MDEFAIHLRRITQITLGVLLVTLILWFFVEQWRSLLAGICLGVFISLLNAHYSAWKIRQLGDVAASSQKDDKPRRVNIGFITRASTSLLAVIISIKSSDIEFSTTLGGLFFVQVISLLLGIYANIKEKGGR